MLRLMMPTTDPFQWRDLFEVLVVLLGIGVLSTVIGCWLYAALKRLVR